MAPLEGIQSRSITSTLSYRDSNDKNSPLRIPTASSLQARPAQHYIQLQNDATKQMVDQIGNILYPRTHQADNQPVALRKSWLHKHDEISPLLVKYEPGTRIDPRQLKVILEYLRPAVKREQADGDLYAFIKQLLVLQKAWLQAAGDYYGLLAYMDMCKERGLYSGGPSFPTAHGAEDVQLELAQTQQRLETNYNALLTVKLSPTFPVSIGRLFIYFDQVKANEEKRQKRNYETYKQAQQAAEKRAAIKRRNERVVARQMNPMIETEMGVADQQMIMDMMNDAMQFELGGSSGNEAGQMH